MFFQSGFLPQHSTETAPLEVLNDIHLNTDCEIVLVMVLLLDAFTALDNMEHNELDENKTENVNETIIVGATVTVFSSCLYNSS